MGVCGDFRKKNSFSLVFVGFFIKGGNSQIIHLFIIEIDINENFHLNFIVINFKCNNPKNPHMVS